MPAREKPFEIESVCSLLLIMLNQCLQLTRQDAVFFATDTNSKRFQKVFFFHLLKL